jgi:hypothetical protein
MFIRYNTNCSRGELFGHEALRPLEYLSLNPFFSAQEFQALFHKISHERNDLSNRRE